MVPLPRYTTSRQHSAARAAAERNASTQSTSARADGGAEIVNLMKIGAGAYYAPRSAAVVEMVEGYPQGSEEDSPVRESTSRAKTGLTRHLHQSTAEARCTWRRADHRAQA